jgi:putative transposase
MVKNELWINNKKVKKLFNKLYFPNNNDQIIKINKNDINITKCNIKNNCPIKKEKENLDDTQIIRTYRVRLNINNNQKQIILGWMKSCRTVYDLCVNKFNNGNINLNYKKLKLEIFKEIYGNSKKDCPYDVLTDEVRLFCSNIKSATKNLKNNNIKHYTIKHRNFKHGQSILIPKKSITNSSIFISKLGKIENFEKQVNFTKIQCDCRMVYDKIFNKFYLYIPEHIKKKVKLSQSSVVALDPGEKVFMAYYSLKNYGFIGENMRNKILFYEQKIRKNQRILNKRKNKYNHKLGNIKLIKRKINKSYVKIKNIVKELHNQTCLFLCKNYKKIIIPIFETQKMICDKKKVPEQIKKRVIEIKKKGNAQKKIREYTKQKRLNGRVKFVLNLLSHYKFRQQLLTKCQEYGCHLEIVTEEYTSQCCGKCGKLSKIYNGRQKQCENCKCKINRDINGARNILIKNYDKWLDS